MTVSTLKTLRQRYNVLCDQIANERLTGDAWTDYNIRKTTGDLCAARNHTGLEAWTEHQFDLKKEREFT